MILGGIQQLKPNTNNRNSISPNFNPNGFQLYMRLINHLGHN